MLTFIMTMSLDDFKEIKKATTIKIKKNLRTGKTFFVAGDETGAVSERFVQGGFHDPVISQVESTDRGETFFLIHGRDEGGARVLATF